MIARTQGQLDYAEQAFERIVRDTRGTSFRERDIPMPAGVSCTPEEWKQRVENVCFQVLLLKNFTLKVCEMPMAGTTGPLPYDTCMSIDMTYEMLQEVSFPHKARFQAEGKILDDGPDGTWLTMDEGGHFMAQMNFSRMEPREPAASFAGLAELSAIDAYQKGYMLLAFLPSFEKYAGQTPYMTGLHDILDPDSLSSGFMSNALKMVFDEWDE